MRLDEIFRTLGSDIFLGIAGIILLYALFGIGYFIIYRKILKGSKKISRRQMIMTALITGYLIIIIGITLLGRVQGVYGRVNLHFLSSYKAAWNKFDVRSWQYIIFNIIMFVPLGILLPIAHKKFQNVVFTLSAGLTLTITIELFQYVTGCGIFELDDIFNNLMGTVVGYSIIMTFFSLKRKQEHKFKKSAAYFLPSLIVILSFVSVFAYYDSKEFGNLSENYDYKINMNDVTIITELGFSTEKRTAPVYKAPSLSRDSAKDFAVEFFNNINIDTSNIEIIDYYEETVFWVRGDDAYNIWLNNLDGSYSYTDYSMFDNAVPKIATAEVIKEKLKHFNINVPDGYYAFAYDEDGNYSFRVKNVVGNTLINGDLSCSYYSDDTIKSIENNMVVYEKVKDSNVISEMEAYEKIKKGKFSYGMYADKIDTIEVNGISLDYRLDSKGYYQPVYIFNSLINDEPYSIIIPALP
ncbi:MAG TPA: hypothetical protein DCM73_04895 [Clostridiales bacterium]|nr:hypothetical protein [Clostridiales bacterium]